MRGLGYTPSVILERRFSRRYRCRFSLTLSAGDGVTHAAEATDVSAVGLAVRVSRVAVEAMASEGRLLLVGDSLTMRLPGFDEYMAVRVCHIRRLALDLYQVGVRFDGSSILNEQALLSLVESPT